MVALKIIIKALDLLLYINITYIFLQVEETIFFNQKKPSSYTKRNTCTKNTKES